MSDTLQELDWVNERAKCDIKSAFELLRNAVGKDVEQYKELSGIQSYYQIEFSSEPGWLFSVSRQGRMMRLAVFNRANDHIAITISAQPTQTLNTVPVFTQTGHCKFRIEGEEGEPLFEWQLRRRVLEPILFGSQ